MKKIILGCIVSLCCAFSVHAADENFDLKVLIWDHVRGTEYAHLELTKNDRADWDAVQRAACDDSNRHALNVIIAAELFR